MLLLLCTLPTAAWAGVQNRPLRYTPPLGGLSDPMLELEKKVDDALSLVVEGLRSALGVGQRVQTGAGGLAPAYVGTWSKSGIVGADAFLDEAMGVPWMKRRAAITGKQTQRLWLEGKGVRLAITDLRGTKTYDLIPDGKPHRGRGFMGLQVRQRVFP